MRSLMGNTTVMFLRGCAASVEVRDLNAVHHSIIKVPRSRCRHESMPQPTCSILWEEDFRGKVTAEIAGTLSRVADKRAIRHAIEVGIEVPGAELITGKTTLGRK